MKRENGWGIVLIIYMIFVIYLLVASASASVCIQVCGHKTIQEAVDAANPGDTIIVSDGTYKENVKIDKSLNIKGNGSDTIVDGTKNGPVFTIGKVNSNVNVVLSGFAIVNGKSSIGGGGILNNGTTTIKDCTISGNTAFKDGGGVLNYGILTVTNSKISQNIALEDGGGINNSGIAEVRGCTLSQNIAGGKGGGIANKKGDTVTKYCNLTVTNSKISQNTALMDGGGILTFWRCNSTMNGGTISRNTAKNEGGGVCAPAGNFTMNGGTISGNSAIHGGGVYICCHGTLTMDGGTISGNSANKGGGVYNQYAILLIKGTSQIISNQATTEYGGGIYIGMNPCEKNLTCDGTKMAIKFNKAHMPLSTRGAKWYRGWGVYFEDINDTDTPITKNGFNPTKQVAYNTHI